MRLSGLLPILLALATALPGQDAEAQQRFARLRGTVRDAKSQAPVAGVRVVIAATGRFTTTDSVGYFEIRDIPSGVIRFIFTAEGYPRAQVSLSPKAKSKAKLAP